MDQCYWLQSDYYWATLSLCRSSTVMSGGGSKGTMWEGAVCLSYEDHQWKALLEVVPKQVCDEAYFLSNCSKVDHSQSHLLCISFLIHGVTIFGWAQHYLKSCVREVIHWHYPCNIKTVFPFFVPSGCLYSTRWRHSWPCFVFFMTYTLQTISIVIFQPPTAKIDLYWSQQCPPSCSHCFPLKDH